MPSNKWNLSKDYYDVLPADSEMDSVDGRCVNCDGIVESDYYIPMDDRCSCTDDWDED